jgi:uncharacterized repeat protein (TIGR01451 family)
MMRARLTSIVVFACICFALGQGVAAAAAPGPGLTIDEFAIPTNFTAGAEGSYQVTVTNVGSTPTDGSEITVSDTLPAGLTAQKIELFWSGMPLNDIGGFLCNTASVQCHFPGFLSGFLGNTLASDVTLTMVVHVSVPEGVSGTALTNTAMVAGGGAPEASVSAQNQVASTLASFGASSFSFHIAGLDGAPDTQAGSHPYEVRATIDLDNGSRKAFHPPEPTSVQDLKDVVLNLPLGFAGSTLSAPQCSLAQLADSSEGSEEASAGGCPPDTVVGHLLTEPATTESANSAIYNVVPERGVPAELGYLDQLHGTHVLYARVAPTPAGYVLQTTSPDVPAVSLQRIVATFYGDPAVRDGTNNAQIPFFTNPTSCSGAPLVASLYMDSWQHPGRYNGDGTPDFSDPNWVGRVSESPPVTGCNSLQFSPELGFQPTTNVADSPSGLEAELKVPQNEYAQISATPTLRTVSVTLPEGMTVDPSAADGLAACSEAQIGWLGGTLENFSPAQPECPEASKVGSLELSTPLLPGVLTGQVYLARQDENPFGSVFGVYVVVDDPVTGVLIKIAGRLLSDPGSGRLTAVFAENPQFPFSDLKLHFFGGPRAELTTPEACGTFQATSDLQPWSAPDSGPDAMPFASFLIGSGCVNEFAPTFAAGSTNLQAGAYTPFVASFSRSDSDQEMGGLSVTVPPGLLANLTGVPLCTDVQATTGTCPEASQVGSVIAAVGPGPNPFFVSGRMFLTGPYRGGPYGFAVEVPAVAGPFDFGMVVVRQSIRVDPHDGHVTVVSDPFPTILNATGADGQSVGVPVRLRRVDVRVERPQFTFNPTNCEPLALTGSLTSTQGTVANLTSHFQVTNCASLPFHPRFTVSTQAKTSKHDGASLTVGAKFPTGAQANIRSVAVILPKQLPARLTTIQQACPAATFAQNPATCPVGSVIGSVTARTPIIAAPFTGPAYLVSHGGAAFPDVDIVLQGAGITLDLTGSVNIKHGITSSDFKTIPDAPINSFTFTLPEGPHSGLAAVLPAKAKGNMCGTSLVMPFTITGQNGALVRQNTRVAVTGCPKAKKAHRPKHKRHKKK